MNFFEITNSMALLSIATVVIFVVLKSFSKYPSAPMGTKFIYNGFFLILLSRILYSIFSFENSYLIMAIMLTQFVGIASIVTGGIKFKSKYYKPYFLFFTISIAGFLSSSTLLAVSFDKILLGNIYQNSLSLGLIILGFCFLLKPKMEKTGGFMVTAFSLFALAFYFFFQTFKSGQEFLATGQYEIIIIASLIVGLVMVSANVMWYQLEFLLTDSKKSKEKLRLVIQTSPFPIVISKLRDDSLILVNDKAANIFGIDTKHPENYKTSDFFADASNRKDLFSALEHKDELENFEVALKKTNSTEKFWMLTSCRVIDFEQEIALYAAFQDISEIKEKESKLYDQATRDPLTNCYNRRQFEELAKKEIYKTSRNGSPFTIVMIDADHFKNVNDTYGHATGDVVLKELAECCRKTLRESDIIVRYGGEEFVLMLPETPVDLAYPVCDRLRENIAALEVIGVNNEVVKFTVSMGLAESSVADGLDEIIEIADAALYIAKQTGRNRLVIGEKGMTNDSAKNNFDTGTFEVKTPGLIIEEDVVNNDDIPLENEKQVIDQINKSIWDEDTDNKNTDNSNNEIIDDIPLDEEEELTSHNKSIWDDDKN